MYDLISYLQFLFLKKFYRIDAGAPTSINRLSLARIFSEEFPKKIQGKFVIDFGCGHGADTEEMAKWGAKLALGLEIRDELVQDNLSRIKLPNISFATGLSDDMKAKADVIISVDAFEHFDDPEHILNLMYDCLRPGGEAHISFGPTWYHPVGGHAFSVFPWAHLLFTEKALVRWRNQFYHDGATRFNNVAGGLNQLPIAQFENIFKRSKFHIESLKCKPIRNYFWLQKILGRELMTSMVLVHLKKPLTS